MIKKLRIFKLVSGNSTYSQLFRTYVVGAINLVFGLGMTYIFQFYVFFGIQVPLRTYLTNIFAFSIGVIISYFLSRKIIFIRLRKNDKKNIELKYISHSQPKN